MNDRKRYVMYGANPASAISTTPARGSAILDKSPSIGADTWVTATSRITTSTSLERMSATTNIAHLEIQPRVASQEAPENANGAKTTATSRSALRTSRLSQTIAAAAMAKAARKMVKIAPTPGAPTFSAVNPATRIAILSPIVAVVSPAAWMMPTESWSTISSSRAVRVITTKEPRTLLASPRAARERAAGSRRIMPVMSCRQKNSSMTNTAIPKIRL